NYRCNDLKISFDWKAAPTHIDNPKLPHELHDKQKWIKTLWLAMFAPDTPVESFELDRTPYKLIARLDPEEINKGLNNIIIQNKNKLLTKSLRELQIPGIYDDAEAEDKQKRSLIQILDHLYDLPIDLKLQSPYLKKPANSQVFPI